MPFSDVMLRTLRTSIRQSCHFGMQIKSTLETGIHFDSLETNMRAVLLVLMSVIVLAGCAAKVISAAPRNVIVQARVQDIADATTLASAECKKHGMYARLGSKPMPNQFSFDCVN